MGPVCTSCWVTHSHTQGVSPCHFGLCCPLLLVATWRWPLLSEQCAPPWLCWCGKSYLNICIFLWCWPYCIIAAFSDITASFQIKRAFLLIFFDWNCLINEQALICADDHTASKRDAAPNMLINEWQLLPGVVYINAARLWKGNNCGAKCCRGWQDPFLKLSRAALIERVMPWSIHTKADERFTPTCVHTCGHMSAHRQNQQPHST